LLLYGFFVFDLFPPRARLSLRLCFPLFPMFLVGYLIFLSIYFTIQIINKVSINVYNQHSILQYIYYMYYSLFLLIVIIELPGMLRIYMVYNNKCSKKRCWLFAGSQQQQNDAEQPLSIIISRGLYSGYTNIVLLTYIICLLTLVFYFYFAVVFIIDIPQHSYCTVYYI